MDFGKKFMDISQRVYLYAEIDSVAIVHNCGIFRELIPSGCKLCPAVKCNAYGHGVEAILPALREADAEMVCVASIEEVVELRQLGWDRPILLLGAELSVYGSNAKREAAEWLVENQVRVTPSSKEDIKELGDASKRTGKCSVVHFMLDSGMTRAGLSGQRLWELLELIKDDERFEIEGLYTHFATADEADKSFVYEQLRRLNSFVDKVRKVNVEVDLIHAANSAAAIDIPESHFDMIRPGVSFYGYHAGLGMHNKPELRPCMKLISFLILVKKVPAGSYIGYGCTYRAEHDMVLGVVPVGYGDGYDRRLSNTGKMIIKGHEVAVVGRVSMDLTIVDVTALVERGLDVGIGQKVVVIGNIRESANSVESLAMMLDTIPYEITTRLGVRIRRVNT